MVSVTTTFAVSEKAFSQSTKHQSTKPISKAGTIAGCCKVLYNKRNKEVLRQFQQQRDQ
jgi:hypothetical protein